MKQHEHQGAGGRVRPLGGGRPAGAHPSKGYRVMGYRSYDMPFIDDKALFAAVMWARKMIREDDVPAGVAINRAAAYYDVEPRYVAHYVGIAAQRIRERKARQCAGGR